MLGESRLQRWDLPDPSGVYSQALSGLFGSLIAQSSKAKFYKSTTGSGQATITGLFQCRGDLSNVNCYNCVSRLPILIDKLCGRPAAARIQLFGCYMLYEVAGFPQISGMEMLYKTCSGKNAQGFEERRDTAFNNLVGGIPSANGFYTTSYESVYVLGQCEGDVGNSDCGQLLKGASEFLAEAFHEGKYVISYWLWILVTGKLFGMWVGKIFGDVGC
nr:cysteine-rich repeat secretory protein 3-like [Ipomoea batatas]